MIVEFTINTLINGSLATFCLFVAYLVPAAALLNLGHGSIADWNSRLAKLSLKLPQDCVEVVEQYAVVKAPLSEQGIKDVEIFLEFHRIVNRAARRIALIQCRWRFFMTMLIIGFAIGAWLSAPQLFSQPSPASSYPALIASIGAAGGVFVILFFNFPHGVDWGRLKEATENANAS